MSSHAQRVLFVCTGNSCRSHMAEAWLRQLGGAQFASFSAGAKPAGFVHPLAVRVMGEAGIDLSGHASKPLDQFRGQPFDFVITVCDRARESCPVFPGAARQLHWSFPDPAEAAGTDVEKLAVFRRIRDEIRRRVAAFLEET
jgi:arsenate reductase (thioredoxin)